MQRIEELKTEKKLKFETEKWKHQIADWTKIENPKNGSVSPTKICCEENKNQKWQRWGSNPRPFGLRP